MRFALGDAIMEHKSMRQDKRFASLSLLILPVNTVYTKVPYPQSINCSNSSWFQSPEFSHTCGNYWIAPTRKSLNLSSVGHCPEGLGSGDLQPWLPELLPAVSLIVTISSSSTWRWWKKSQHLGPKLVLISSTTFKIGADPSFRSQRRMTTSQWDDIGRWLLGTKW